jgi:hypothetical protein
MFQMLSFFCTIRIQAIRQQSLLSFPLITFGTSKAQHVNDMSFIKGVGSGANGF